MLEEWCTGLDENDDNNDDCEPSVSDPGRCVRVRVCKDSRCVLTCGSREDRRKSSAGRAAPFFLKGSCVRAVFRDLVPLFGAAGAAGAAAV